VVCLSAPHTTYSSRRAHFIQVEGKSPLGPSRRGRDKVPFLSGPVMYAAVSSSRALAPFTSIRVAGEPPNKIFSPLL